MIKIAGKLHPFSQIPGTKVMVPGTTVRVTVYPTRVEFDDLSEICVKPINSYDLDLEGPVEDFTVQLDLEKGRICVWGESEKGFFRYHITPKALTFEKGGEKKIDLNFAFENQGHIEKLSLGCSKKQDWSLVMRRFQLDEVFPYWYRLAQMLPRQKPAVHVGAASILPNCCSAIIEGDRNAVLTPFEDLLRVGFEGLLSPRMVDNDYNGIPLKPIANDHQTNPVAMLIEGALLMRALFFQREENLFKILPALPTSFHCGRMLHIQCGDFGFLDMEWTKKLIRRMVFVASKDGEVNFEFSKDFKSYRLCIGGNTKGSIRKTGELITICKGETYTFDRFEK